MPTESEKSSLGTSQHGAFPVEADTLTTHAVGVLPDRSAGNDDSSTATLRRIPRRDTMPVPPSLSGRTVTATLATPSDPPAGIHHVDPIEEIDAIDDDDILAADPYEDSTQAALTKHARPAAEPPALREDDPPNSEDETSPTLALANRSDSAREIYRLFLASEYAPALALANELLAQGDDDPMLITIARECRVSLTAQSMSSAPPAPEPVGSSDHRFAYVDGKMTLEQVATMTGMSLDQVLHLLERFVSLGVINLRPTR